MATRSAPASPTPDTALPKTEAPAPLRAAHTPNFPALLRQLGASLVVTTYQAGKLVLVCDEGDSSSENSFTVPDAALADVSASLRAPAGNGSVPREAAVKL